MTTPSTVSAAAASRERTGLNHIGRLVELWLARYEQLAELNKSKHKLGNDQSTITTVKLSAQAKPRKNESKTVKAPTVRSTGTRKKQSRRKRTTRHGLPVASTPSPTQATFGFYQVTE